MHLFHSSSPLLPFIRSRFIIPLFPQLHHQHQRTFISTPPSLKSISIPDADIDIPPPTPSPCSLLKVTNIPAPHTGHIRILSLNSPRNRNALSRQLVKELRYELKKLKKKKKKNEKKTNEAQGLSGKRNGKRAEDAVEEDDDDDDVREGDFKIDDFYTEGFRDDDTRCLILASELDNAFCSGADLKERRDMSRNETIEFLRSLRQTFRTLSSLPIPSISAISSTALGGGLELALASTLRIFSASAMVGLPETRLAIIPGAGGTYRLRHLIGEARAMEMILTGRLVTGAQAYEMGMCEKLVPTAKEEYDSSGNRELVLRAALGTAISICNGAPGAIGPAMRAVKSANPKAEADEYMGLLQTEDRIEALIAFAEKRKPVFKGR